MSTQPIRTTDQSQVDIPSEPGPTKAKRSRTATLAFGSGRRESHDATSFYDRFVSPTISTDSTINTTVGVDTIHHHDARHMVQIADNSVALVVTSPPYFAGKQYEADLSAEGVPSDYFEYLQLLRDVFSECVRVLEPGGRIAVNVANLGRRPYRSLSADITQILSDLGLLMRGEVIWWKGRAAGGSCAWGTFQQPANPVLRDMTERVIIASKGRFDRALTPVERAKRGLPSTATISRDEFMEATTDLWELSPERASRVGHPAPFPVELPTRLIHLYTYEGDLIVDPFMGSGSSAVAAVRTGRHFVGFDTDASYVRAALQRIATERDDLAERLEQPGGRACDVNAAAIAAVRERTPIDEAVAQGRQTKEVARLVLESCGFSDISSDYKPRGLGIVFQFSAVDAAGHTWAFDVSGSFTTGDSGLKKSDNLWRSIAKASVLHAAFPEVRLALLTTHAPVKGSTGFMSLKALRPKQGESSGNAVITDVIELLNDTDHQRLVTLARGDAAAATAGDALWS